jgi:hypothetical protein
MYNKEVFDEAAIKGLQAYVYALVDPRNNKIFYVGKGSGNRVFEHVRNAIANYRDDEVDENGMSLKVKTIRQIIAKGQEVRMYILKHGMTEGEAFMVESVLIDLLTYPDFQDKIALTNVVAGHHQNESGIKSVDEVKAYYSKPIDDVLNSTTDKLLIVKLNLTFTDNHRTIYEKARGSWLLAEQNAKKADYVLAVYNGVVRAVFKPKSWHHEQSVKGKRLRWTFDGEEVKDSPYLYTNVSKYANGRNPVAYLNYHPGKLTINSK